MSGDEGVGYRIYDEDEFLATGLLGEHGDAEPWTHDARLGRPGRRSAARAVLAAVLGAAVGLAIVMTLRVIVGGWPPGSGHPVARVSSHRHALVLAKAAPRPEHPVLLSSSRRPASAPASYAGARPHRATRPEATPTRSQPAPRSEAQPEAHEFGFEP